MTIPATRELVARWCRRQARCRECGWVYESTSCPTCGERQDATPVAMVGVITETLDGAAQLSLVEVLDGDRVVRSTRQVSGEQLRWLRRHHGPATGGEVR